MDAQTLQRRGKKATDRNEGSFCSPNQIPRDFAVSSSGDNEKKKKKAALEETRLENKEGYPFPHVRTPARQTKRTLPLRPTVLKPWVSIGLGFVLFCFVFDGEKKRKVGCFFVLLWRSGNKGYRQKTNTSSR